MQFIPSNARLHLCLRATPFHAQSIDCSTSPDSREYYITNESSVSALSHDEEDDRKGWRLGDCRPKHVASTRVVRFGPFVVLQLRRSCNAKGDFTSVSVCL